MMTGLMVGILISLIVISSIVSLILIRLKRHKSFALFKPLTTILIIILGIFAYDSAPGIYSGILLISLVFALFGDVFLLYKNYFMQGLASFMVAQTGFTIAFVVASGFSTNLLLLLPFALYGIVFYGLLKNYLELFKVPVIIYNLVIIIMAWQAAGLAYNIPSTPGIAIVSGAVLFLISDSALAWQRFRNNRTWFQFIILPTYWLAIALFVMAGFYLP
jgi:uncharacterized membrane protein YhhN